MKMIQLTINKEVRTFSSLTEMVDEVIRKDMETHEALKIYFDYIQSHSGDKYHGK